jgi:hypothetical protein
MSITRHRSTYFPFEAACRMINQEKYMMVPSLYRNTVANNCKTTYHAYYKFKKCTHHIRHTVPHAHSKNHD